MMRWLGSSQPASPGDTATLLVSEAGTSARLPLPHPGPALCSHTGLGWKWGLSVSNRGALSTRGHLLEPLSLHLQDRCNKATCCTQQGALPTAVPAWGTGFPAQDVSSTGDTDSLLPAPSLFFPSTRHASFPPHPTPFLTPTSPSRQATAKSPTGDSSPVNTAPGSPCATFSVTTPCGNTRPPTHGGLWAWCKVTCVTEGQRTHTGVIPRLCSCFQFLNGRRSCRPVSSRDFGDTAPSVGLGRVASGQRGCHFLRTEPVQEVQVLQPPLGIDWHLAPEPVKLARKQKAFPRGECQAQAECPPALAKAALTWRGSKAHANQKN